MKARYDEKYTWLKSMLGGFWWYFKVCWLYSRCPFSHYPSLLFRHHIHQERWDKNPSWLNTHIRNIHAWLSLLASWRYIYTHFISPVLIVFRISLHLFFFSPLALDDKNIFIFLGCLRRFPSFDLNILDKRRKRKNNFPLSPLSMHGHTRVLYAYDIFWKATLVSHVLSSTLEIHKTCFSSFEIFSILTRRSFKRHSFAIRKKI